ncbi:PD-(D/E)XK nuclease family transposase [Rhodopirellula sp. JC639]|uniref:PD-(D/E)XK nuclease family transposase n=1 Tax=Stieleria mannarensis TaxID=2755585 RepID=UPI0015FF07DA|nr:PD-(D/E)XK nuclease family transposase [Rhodopirellula sp. JC639]
MILGIDPTVDFVFKLLLGSPEHPVITLHFLNAILGEEIEIVDVEILNPILGKEDDLDQISEGDDYTQLRPAISICVLDALLFRQSQQIHSDSKLGVTFSAGRKQ